MFLAFQYGLKLGDNKVYKNKHQKPCTVFNVQDANERFLTQRKLFLPKNTL